MGRKDSYQFGPYFLNANESVLMRDGSPVGLTPKVFDTLMVLVRNRGHLVEKEHLMKEVWPETTVEEANLTQNISTLRRILGESDETLKYIETVPRRGYRFVAPVQELFEPEADLIPVKPGQVRGEGSVAVLPFVNASGDYEMDYLSDGITVNIINNLSQMPMLRVMSQTAVFRYKGKEQDAQQIGRELGVTAVLVGRIHSHDGGLLISAELVDVANGWQLWGETYDHPAPLLGLQVEIARQISAALRSKLTGDDERRLSLRYTKNESAYQSYLKGRYHWIKYDRAGLVQALSHFRDAITLDPYYILAYAGSVDCCLRLVTNYIPTEDNMNELSDGSKVEESHAIQTKLARTIKLKYEWDQKVIERELKRAAELKTNFPAVHQWHAAFKFAISLLKNNSAALGAVPNLAATTTKYWNDVFEHHSPFIGCSPTMSEEVQVFCAIAREQIESGNYEAATLLLERWWVFGQWPKVDGLSPASSSDLLFTAGALAGYQASAKQLPAGQKHAEALLNGSIAIFEQLGSKRLATEGRIELSWCYYREGLFGLTCETLNGAIHALADDEIELKSLALARLATVEYKLGRVHDARRRLEKLAEKLVGPLTASRYNLELASTLKELAISESRSEYFDQALRHYNEALYHLDAIGHHRYAAIVENNHGYLLLALDRLAEAEGHLIRARSLFEVFGDREKQAQVDDTLARLHVAAKRFELANDCISRAVEMLEAGGEDALLAESLRTKGLVLCRLGRHRAAKKALERAQQVAEHCGDMEGAGRAILVLIEEMGFELPDEELEELGSQVYKLLANSQRALIRERLKKTLDQVHLRTKSKPS